MSVDTQKADLPAAKAAEEADEFAAVLKQSFKPRTERAATEVDNAIGTLVALALADQSVVQEEALDTVLEMIARLDGKISAQVNEILHADAFQEIESAWRGLHHLVYHSATGPDLKIRVMNISKSELYQTLKSYTGETWDQSPIFKKIYEAEYDQLGGEPYGCLIGDYYFNHDPTDVQLLTTMSRIAAAAHAPFISGAAPGLLGMDSWNEVVDPQDLAQKMDGAEHTSWKSLRDSDDASYVGLCMPRVLARRPYGQRSEPVSEFAFEEETDGHTGENYAWMNAAYAMATNINRAFKDYGWCTRIRGPESGGNVRNLPTHAFKTDGGVDLKCPTEVAISERREVQLSGAGLIPLIHRKNTDTAAFFSAQSLYKPKKDFNPEATASSNLRSRLPYIFAVSRIAHYLKCMIRDKIGTTRNKEQLQRWLTEWIRLYVDGDPAHSDEATKAKRPLADAKIELFEDEENPGVYRARFLLKPHYQLEAMDVSLSLVSRIPSLE